MTPPFLARHLFYPLHEALLRRPTFSMLRDLEASQWRAREEIERLQESALTSLLQTAARHAPWHAGRIEAAGVDPFGSEPVTLEALRKIPPMTKADARRHGSAMAWEGVPGGAQSYNTGGSSGEPLIFRFGRRRQASDAAGRMRSRAWWGVAPGEPEVYLWGAPVELNKTDRLKNLRDGLINQWVMNAFEMTPARMDGYLEAVRAIKPACLYGYASSVTLLAGRAKARGIDMRLPGLKVVATTGEPLFDHQRALIQEVFGVPAANEFGSRDVGFTAHETPEGKLLLLSESIILESLDPEGNPVGPGEMGEAVMTGLHSEAQPFIRYRTGDMVRLSGAACPAGRGLHVIDEVAGRTTDFLVKADGAVMHALGVIYVVREVPGVAAFKIIQHAVDELEVWVVPGEAWDEAARERVVAGLIERMGAGTSVDVVLKGEIPPEDSGKYRYVVSRVPVEGVVDS